jgi:hypothetical protein
MIVPLRRGEHVMSNTVLGFWDFFWIWFIVVVMNGGTSYLGSAKESIEALQKEVATLTEEIRRLRGESSGPG